MTFELIGSTKDDYNNRVSIAVFQSKGCAYIAAQAFKADYQALTIIERKIKYPALKGSAIDIRVV
jgi:hypothetical protein